MMLSSEGLIDLLDRGGGPLCPQSLPPVSQLHALRVAISDAVYQATEKNADGDPATAALAKVSEAANYGFRTSDRMRLYRDTVVALDTTGTATVEALYFRCMVCGFVLPAQRSPR